MIDPVIVRIILDSSREQMMEKYGKKYRSEVMPYIQRARKKATDEKNALTAAFEAGEIEHFFGKHDAAALCFSAALELHEQAESEKTDEQKEIEAIEAVRANYEL